MALNASLNKFKSEISDAASRNVQHARPSSTASARSSTPKPTASENKRPHDVAFSNHGASAPTSLPSNTGRDILTQVFFAVAYLKEKSAQMVSLNDLIGYLSLDNDQKKHIPNIKQALQKNERVEYFSKSESGTGKESFRYRPMHPVTNAEELKTYLARQPSAQGVSVKDLKDGWPDCTSVIDDLERQGCILVTRRKKDNTPVTVWIDSPSYHILNPTTHFPQKIDSDFVDFWSKTKLPASEIEIRTELEKAGLTPTSQVKEMRNLGEGRKKEKKKRVNRRGGKTTNAHMLGILKDYSAKR